MKKNKKLKIIGFALFSFLSIGTLASCSLFDKIKDIITGTDNEVSENTGEEFIKGTSFLNYDGVKGLKDTEYTLTASVTPANHTSPIVWTSDFPQYVSVVPGENDTATIIRHEDYRGYVNITASIDGLSASCQVSCIDNKRVKNVSLKNRPVFSYNSKYYWNEVVDREHSNDWFSLSVEYTSTTCETTNIANFDSNAYFDNSTINTNSQWIHRWDSLASSVSSCSFISLDGSKSKSSGNAMFELKDDNTYVLKDIVFFKFTDKTLDQDIKFYSDNETLTLSFMEYIIATNITLDKTTITI